MRSLLKIAGILGALCAFAVNSAHAMPQQSLSTQRTSSFMRHNGYALAPLAFVEFCHRYPRECPTTPSLPAIALTDAMWTTLQQVNLRVNRQITPQDEPEGVDDWELDVSAGDCDSYAIEKRHELLALGLPAAALSLTQVSTKWGEHLVLTVRTDRGAFVLDSLRGVVLPWTKTGYKYVKMQSAKNIKYWVSIDGESKLPDAPMPASIILASNDHPDEIHALPPREIQVVSVDGDGGVAAEGAIAMTTSMPDVAVTMVETRSRDIVISMPDSDTTTRMAIWNEAVFALTSYSHQAEWSSTFAVAYDPALILCRRNTYGALVSWLSREYDGGLSAISKLKA